MNSVTDILMQVVSKVNQYLSDYILTVLLIGIGIFYSFKTRFVQIRCFGEGLKVAFRSKNKDTKGLTSFQSLMTSVAAQVGTGNIIGVCSAILIGGPGAVFWMWVTAFFGMATIYAEAVLAQETKKLHKDGSVIGGPVLYIQKAFNGALGKFLADFFAVALILSLGFMGAMVQANAISESLGSALEVKPWVIGLILAVICALVFIGGIQRLSSVTEKTVPIMAMLYIIIGCAILCVNFRSLPNAFGMIFKYAFVPNAIIGGCLGSAIKTTVSQGVKRGLFSNEAGMGSTPHAHALADVKRPHDQGIVAMFGVFIDTFIVLTVTALSVITVLYTDGEQNLNISKTDMMQTAVGKALGNPELGSILISVCLTLFAFTSIISWNCFGKMNVEYLFGKGNTKLYSATAVVFIFLGSCFPNDLVWELSDMFTNLMVIPNVMALFVLHKNVERSALNK